MYRIFIDGKEGTTGLRIYERIHACKDISLLALSEEDRKNNNKRQEMLHACDIAFLCLPDAAAREAVELAKGSNARILDASTAHRVDASFTYGFPELSQAQYASLSASDRVAVPGCHASGYIALVHPLVQAGLLSPDALLSCTSLTGYSGGGKGMIGEYQAQERSAAYNAPKHYALAQAHKHLPEMQAYSGLIAPPVFLPVVADYYQGMLVTIPLHLGMLQKKATLAQIREVYEAHYANRPLISLLPDTAQAGFLSANGLAGKDTMELGVFGNEERMTLLARYDNLGKGASGAAVQCMNIMLGKHEAETLATE